MPSLSLCYGPDDGSRDLARAVAELTERLPDALAPLARLVFNYRWSWLPDGAAVFRELDADLWRKSCCNPRETVEALPPRRLREMAGDPAYVKRVEACAAQLEAELAAPPAPSGLEPAHPVAYFCSEFGAHCSLPLYGGGLGVLAGDLLKAASDLALPLIGVGLLYPRGYFHQRLEMDGWQHEYWYPTWFERLPAVRVSCDGQPVRVALPLRGREVAFGVWRIDFGRVPLFLLDSDVPENHPIDRWITDRLYVGDRETRLAQYAALGPAGVRALSAMGIRPGLVHLNEGHAALGAFERVAALRRDGVPEAEAFERVRAGTVFTTHTPIAAGNEWYRRDEAEPVLAGLRQELGFTPEAFYGLGGFEPASPDAPVAVTLMALRTSRAANGVSRRHGQVARAMWQRVWPERSVDEVPIGHVTNGVHTTSWMAGPMQRLLDRHLGADWRQRLGEAAPWSQIGGIPDEEIWAVRRELRSDLVRYVRERSISDRLNRGESAEYVEAAARVFHPDRLTVGFARRVATYKRLHLLTRRLDLGLRLLADGARPIQMVVAGKAHPKDDEAKRSLQALFAARHQPNVSSHIAFLEDYDLHAATRIVAGVDLWLNLPRPPLEASGTSGMKIVLNGGLNLSVLDGWWEEAYDGECGWGVSSPEADPAVQDDRDAVAVFNLLENEVLPLFYEQDAHGVPHRWLARVKHSMERLIPRFSAERMLRDYVTQLYGSDGQPTPPLGAGDESGRHQRR